MMPDAVEDSPRDDFTKGEQQKVWEDLEKGFWPKHEKDHREWKVAREEEFSTEKKELQAELTTIQSLHNLLRQKHQRLSQKLIAAEEELRQIGGRLETKSNSIVTLEEEYRAELKQRVEKHERASREMRRFFSEKLGRPADSVEQRPEPMEGVEISAPRVEAATSNSSTERGPETPAADPVVNVVDCYGNIIGPIETVRPWNQWVDAVLKLPIQRDVVIRRGRKFDKEKLAGIYTRTDTDAKGVKWLSCMIQATGAVQSTRCVSCAKDQGVFEHCVAVGGEILKKCGNCEWNRQGCHGTSGERIDLSLVGTATGNKGESRSRKAQAQTEEDQQVEEREKQHQESVARRLEDARRRREVEARENLVLKRPPPPHNVRRADRTISASHDQEARRVSSSGNLNVARASSRNSSIERPAILSGFTPANRPVGSRATSLSRASSRDIHTPTALYFAEQSLLLGEPLDEINKNNLVLRNNGEVYTHPECMKGVPLVKITSDHPYWDPDWKDVRAEIQAHHDRWREKLEQTASGEQRGEKPGTNKYQIGRQVNRGYKIMEFLDEGSISPYQLLAKKHMYSSRGGITAYDTLFRLCETFSELEKFKLDVTPVDWVRHRLHEILMVKGPEFNLAKIIHDFYHDPKLTALRSKHGFKNIGRPSGSRASLDSSLETPSSQSKKRKSLGAAMEATRNNIASLPKRHKHNAANLRDPFAVGEEFSDVDSVSGDQIFTEEYRLVQVKTKQYASPRSMTQYWAWQPDRQALEHQVLLSASPAKWGKLGEAQSLDFGLEEVGSMWWGLETLRIWVSLPEREGEVVEMVGEFKRQRTMKRFLGFCRHMKVVMVEKSRQDIDAKWDAIQSAETLTAS